MQPSPGVYVGDLLDPELLAQAKTKLNTSKVTKCLSIFCRRFYIADVRLRENNDCSFPVFYCDFFISISILQITNFNDLQTA